MQVLRIVQECHLRVLLRGLRGLSPYPLLSERLYVGFVRQEELFRKGVVLDKKISDTLDSFSLWVEIGGDRKVLSFNFMVLGPKRSERHIVPPAPHIPWYPSKPFLLSVLDLELCSDFYLS